MTDANLTVINPEPMVVTVPPPDQELLERVKGFAEAAGKLVVSDAKSRDGAALQLREVATLSTLIDKNRKERTKVLDDKKKEYMEAYRPAEKLLADARAALTNTLTAYDREQERLRREEQARLDREAEKERAKLARQADRAAAKGDMAKAMDLDTQAATTAAPVVPVLAKAEGLSTRTVWKFAIIPNQEHQIPREFCKPDETAIRKYVEALKERAVIPGVRIYSEETTVVRGL